MRRSVSAVLSGAAALSLLAAPVRASEWHGVTAATWGGCDSPARLAPRHDAGSARIAITTDDGAATLILTDDVVALQLSDRTFKHIERRFREEEEEDDGALGAVIKSAVFASVRSVLDHSAECPVRHIRSASFRDGRLEIETDRGRMLFSNVHVSDDEETMSGFSDRDAEAFVKEFWRVKNGR